MNTILAASTIDSEIITKMVFYLVGGLGIFLLGMKNMSEGMQAVAGERIRKLIGAVTNNRFMACGVGTLVTCIVQSSSVTSVMVVGMVNAGIMNLMQAIGVILGANIGTTITGWVLVLKISKYGLPMLGIAAFFFLFSKKDKIRFTASFFMGLGMVFFGLALMKEGFKPLRDMPAFVEMFAKFSPSSYFDYINIIKCVLVGAALTAVVQSSSATLGITISLAATGAINFPAAAALVLGENIGTTITAYLASLGASTNAKRASYAHMMINVIGVIWIVSIFGLYIPAVVKFVGLDDVVSPTNVVVAESDKTEAFGFRMWEEPKEGSMPEAEYEVAKEEYASAALTVTAAIAATHTGFNVVNMLVFLPFVGFLGRFLNKVVPDKAHKEKPHLTFLDVRMLDTPAISIEQSQKEIIKMSQMTASMMDMLRIHLAADFPDRSKTPKIFKREKILDVMQKEIMEFLSSLLAGNVSHDVIDAGRSQLRMADEYESVSDYITTILKLKLKMADTNET
ncbi:MAG: Na/Pi cotransporter family protein, partial [Anaerohalosphaera sp.]|nr:Na/Pi cotransporter family protein [Anaerohalosphaera sp.]